MATKPRANDAGPPAKRPPTPATETVPTTSSESNTPASLGPITPASAFAPTAEFPSAVTRSLVGQTLGDLEFLEELGRGGMGIVYKARQKSLNRIVAVKLLLANAHPDPIRLARFYAEARAVASLTHDNIVRVYQIGECAAGHFFAMEYIDGHSLEKYLHTKQISVAAAVSVMTVVARAVHFAHQKGIIHRDLKPANIMLDRARRPVVMDFGIVKFVGGGSRLTQHGTIVGTPAYMAPEQAEEDAGPLGPHSDIYALGAVLYSLLARRPPFEESTPLRTMIKVIGPELPASIRRFRRDVPGKLERICMKCLSKAPSERYATALDLAEELQRVHTRLRTGGTPTMKAKSADTTMVSKPTRVILVSNATGEEISLRRACNIVGRTSDCDLIVRATDVSKHHCQVVFEEEQVVVEDLASANGTFVNQRQVNRAVLHDGDRLRLASHEFVVRIRGATR